MQILYLKNIYLYLKCRYLYLILIPYILFFMTNNNSMIKRLLMQYPDSTIVYIGNRTTRPKDNSPQDNSPHIKLALRQLAPNS